MVSDVVLLLRWTLTLATVNAFQARLPCATSKRTHAQSCLLRSSKRVAVGRLRMGYLDDLEPPKAKTTDGKGNKIMPDMDYKSPTCRPSPPAPSRPRICPRAVDAILLKEHLWQGFIDGEGFDGGDGQVGVVGDGKNAMEEFEDRIVIDNSIGGAGRGKVAGGSSGNRIDKRWNAWGAGEHWQIFEDQLKADGMVDIDIFTGEDKKQVQRQQYENWFNQQKQWQAERKLRDQMEALNNGKRQKNLTALCLQYIARFTEDSAPEFVVAKTGYDLGEREVAGALPRRGLTSSARLLLTCDARKSCRVHRPIQP
eukprot:756550-Hanusia_phi.AAC.1